jgi:hypothetical protein
VVRANIQFVEILQEMLVDMRQRIYYLP